MKFDKKENETFPLRIILWEATLQCNAHCAFCGSRCEERLPQNELSTGEICAAFRQIANQADAEKIMINVTGGEPLLRADLFDVMTYAASLGFRWGLVTNGTLLTAQTVDALRKAGMRTLAVSIDGMQQVHDEIRGVKNGFQKIVQGLEYVRRAGFAEQVMVTTVVSGKNIDELPKLRDFLAEQPINSWRICPVDPIGRAGDDPVQLLSVGEWQRVMDFIAECRMSEAAYETTTSCSHYLGRYELAVRQEPFRCRAGKTVGSILANGDIFVCPNVPRDAALIQGNIRRDSFVAVWQNGFAPFRDAAIYHTGKCKDCRYFPVCKGDSLHTRCFADNEPLFCARDYQLTEEKDMVQSERKSLPLLLQQHKNGASRLFDYTVAAQSATADCVIFAPEATTALLRSFRWGTLERTTEQICALYGNIYPNGDCRDEAFLVEVMEIAALTARDVTEKTLRFDRNVIEQAENAASERMLIGFAHSHPNELGVAMSAEDYRAHRELYRADWTRALTVILNPQKKQIAAYSGPFAEHTQLHILTHQKI